MLDGVKKWIRTLFPAKTATPLSPAAIFKTLPQFNKNKIFIDAEFSYTNTFLDVKTFLATHNSFLADYTIGTMLVSDWIMKQCELYDVSPKLILVQLERYSRLVSASVPPSRETLDRALNIGVLKSCVSPGFSGLDRQIAYCAQQYRRWFDRYTAYGTGRPMCMDDATIKPENAFTYALYMMDPYVGVEDLYKVATLRDTKGVVTGTTQELQYTAPFGAYLTWRLWANWFPL